MADKRYHPGIWALDCSRRAWGYVAPGWYDESVELPFVKILNHEEIEQLIKALDEHGWIKPRLDERLRSEDLKITHRLLDLLNVALQSGGR